MTDNTQYMIPDLLTVQEFGAMFHMCRQSVYKLIRTGVIRAFKNPVGKYLIPRDVGKYLIPRDCVEKMLDGCYNVDTANACNAPRQGGISNVG